jgi:2-polyprenyl-3-methyl-5-hydroxy-6-metoxy-1,4-benzoquinol methylase
MPGRTLMKLALVPYQIVSAAHWWMVRRLIRTLGPDGLHRMVVGETSAGNAKVRSLYREDMLLATALLMLDLRGRSCLDLGCGSGFWSFRLGQLGITRLLGLDIDEGELMRANFLKTVHNFPGFVFERRDVVRFLLEGGEDRRDRYDVVLLLSLLYHLPEQTDWDRFFGVLSSINDECLVIDSRWFEDDTYWHDRDSPAQGVVRTEAGPVKKWRPTRGRVGEYLYASGYERVVEVDPSAVLKDPRGAAGDGDPYSLRNVADYISGHRSILIAYKRGREPGEDRGLRVKHVPPPGRESSA